MNDPISVRYINSSVNSLSVFYFSATKGNITKDLEVNIDPVADGYSPTMESMGKFYRELFIKAYEEAYEIFNREQ